MTQIQAAAGGARVDQYFKDYASFHRTPGNQTTHMFGIPLIVLAVLGLFASLQFGPQELFGTPLLRLDAGILVWLFASIWYFTLDAKLAAPFVILILGFYFLGRAIPVPALWGAFVGGWVIQYIGHYAYEKKSPAFYKNFQHLLIGPFWIFAKIVGYKR